MTGRRCEVLLLPSSRFENVSDRYLQSTTIHSDFDQAYLLCELMMLKTVLGKQLRKLIAQDTPLGKELRIHFGTRLCFLLTRICLRARATLEITRGGHDTWDSVCGGRKNPSVWALTVNMNGVLWEPLVVPKDFLRIVCKILRRGLRFGDTRFQVTGLPPRSLAVRSFTLHFSAHRL